MPSRARQGFSWAACLYFLGVMAMSNTVHADDAALRQAVTFYASFDEKAAGDFGQGDLRLWTRADDPMQKGQKVISLGYDDKRIRIVRDAGRSAGALHISEPTPNSAFIFFPAAGKLAVRKGGWGGAVSLWVKADVGKVAPLSPWDPFLLVERGWNNGAVWCDFAPGASERDLRIGLFPTLPEGKTPPTLEEGEKIWRQVKVPQFRSGTWHHLVQIWDNFDTGKADGWTSCYLDGQLVGEIKGRDATMGWDLDKVRFHLGSGMVGYIDEVALFRRPLAVVEVKRLFEVADVFRGMKN